MKRAVYSGRLKVMMKHGKKDYLIPLEKSRRTIYLEKRGRNRRNMSIPAIILLVLGALCLLYCVGIGLFVSFGSKFFLVWGALGVLLTGMSAAISNRRFLEGLPGWIKLAAVCLVAFGAIVFIVVELLILGSFGAKAPPGADYCVILGAQVYADGPSEVLKRRLDTAVNYLEENPDTIAVVSGGQGKDEPMSEAEGMYHYLIKSGIASDRILLENQSENTYGNLLYSSRLLDMEQSRVVVVTNNFHVFRAVKIAKKMGYREVSGLAADSVLGMLPNNLFREFFGVVKDFLVGNL